MLSSPPTLRVLGVKLRILFLLFLLSISTSAQSPTAPTVTKLDPPTWWVNLTPDVTLLLSGTHLQATHVSCNLPDVIVNRTQSSSNGTYLFVWLKFGPELKSGTAVCRITTANGETTFELPLAARKQILGRNQGLSLDDVLYEIDPARFASGDLRGVRDHLPYLKDLGVTTIALTPILKNGHASDDLYAVDPPLGTVRDYQNLVEAAHQQHMKIFFDIISNHVGPQHPWVKNPPMPDWFHGTADQHFDAVSPLKNSFYGQAGNNPNTLFESLADPHTTPQMRRNLTDGWLSNQLPDLNTENPIVVDYLTQNAIWWAETSGLDGYQIDALPYVPRKSWEDWHTALRKHYPRLSTIGDVVHPDPSVTSFFVGGRKGWDGVDTQLTTLLDFPTYFAIRDILLNNVRAGEIPNILRQDSLYPHPEYLVPFFDNHDTMRFGGIPAATPAKMKLAYGLVLTLRGIPELYFGDEIAIRANSNARPSPMNSAATPQDSPAAQSADPFNSFSAQARTLDQQDLFLYVQTLLRLRREHDAFRAGKLWHLAATADSYVFLRATEEEQFIVAFNNSPSAKTIKLSLRNTPAENTSSLSPILGEAQLNLNAHDLTLTLPPQSLSILQLH